MNNLLFLRMKKLFLYMFISMIVSGSAVSDNINNINKLIKKGYVIINEEVVQEKNSLRFTKVLTLQRRYSLIICSLVFNSDAYLNYVNCTEP